MCEAQENAFNCTQRRANFESRGIMREAKYSRVSSKKIEAREGKYDSCCESKLFSVALKHAKRKQLENR